MGVEDFINAIADDKMTDAKAAFETELKTRVTDAIDAKRMEVGQAMSAFQQETPEVELGTESD